MTQAIHTPTLLERTRAFVRSEGLTGFLFIAPWLIGFVVFMLRPLLTTFYYSLTKYTLLRPPEWLGTANYERLFTDPVFAVVLRNMLFYVPLSTAITLAGGLGLALLLKNRFPGHQVFRTLFYLPTLLVGVGTGLLFKQVFNGSEIGLINQALGLFSLPQINWLSNSNNPFLGVVSLTLVNLWFTGGVMLIFIAGLKGIPESYYEAAQLDGATSWQMFRSITLPVLSPVIVFNLVLTLIGHLQVFETPAAFSGIASSAGDLGDPLGYQSNLGTFLLYIYLRGFKYQEFGYASAMSVVVFVISLLLTLGVLWFMRRYTFYGDLEKGAE